MPHDATDSARVDHDRKIFDDVFDPCVSQRFPDQTQVPTPIVSPNSKTSPQLEVEESSQRIFDFAAWNSFFSNRVSYRTENTRIYTWYVSVITALLCVCSSAMNELSVRNIRM